MKSQTEIDKHVGLIDPSYLLTEASDLDSLSLSERKQYLAREKARRTYEKFLVHNAMETHKTEWFRALREAEETGKRICDCLQITKEMREQSQIFPADLARAKRQKDLAYERQQILNEASRSSQDNFILSILDHVNLPKASSTQRGIKITITVKRKKPEKPNAYETFKTNWCK